MPGPIAAGYSIGPMWEARTTYRAEFRFALINCSGGRLPGAMRVSELSPAFRFPGSLGNELLLKRTAHATRPA